MDQDIATLLGVQFFSLVEWVVVIALSSPVFVIFGVLFFFLFRYVFFLGTCISLFFFVLVVVLFISNRLSLQGSSEISLSRDLNHLPISSHGFLWVFFFFREISLSPLHWLQVSSCSFVRALRLPVYAILVPVAQPTTCVLGSCFDIL